MPDVRLIDANAVCRKISESIRQANEWENEAREKKDTHGVKYAIDTRRSLLSMLSRVQEEPTIDAQPVKHGHWNRKSIYYVCSECGIELIDDNFEQITIYPRGYMPFCPNCTAKMEGVKNGNQV